MRIGVLAERAGVRTSGIRFYEARGLLPRPERRRNGYRDYDERALEIILFINRARGLGFSLAEIAAHIYSPRDGTRKLRLLSGMETKLSELDALLVDLRGRRAALSKAIEELRGRKTTSSRLVKSRRG
jgi:MerR family transcriptional regulator, copper efflux regulator